MNNDDKKFDWEEEFEKGISSEISADINFSHDEFRRAIRQAQLQTLEEARGMIVELQTEMGGGNGLPANRLYSKFDEKIKKLK